MFGLTKKQSLMLLVLVSGTFITILNQTLVTPVLPTVMSTMSVDASTVQWLTTGFTLMNAVMIPVTAFLMGRFKTKQLFVVSMFIFTFGTVLVGCAPVFWLMLVGRLIQAAGAGILMPMVSTILLLTFPVERRGFAMGIFGVVLMFAPALGPTVAGIVIDNFDYHILFYAVAMLALMDVFFAFVTMSNDPTGQVSSRLDKPSLALSTIGFGTLLYGFSSIGSYGFSALSGIASLIGAAVVVLFFRRQLRLDEPMLDVSVLEVREFRTATIIGMIVQAALMANSVLIPIFVQNLSGQSATVSGLVMLPGAIIMGVMSPVAGKLFDKHGPRKLALTGMVLLTVSTTLMSTLSAEISMIVLCCIVSLRMFSMTLVNMPLNTWGMNSLRNDHISHGNAAGNTLRQVAGSLGTAVVVSVYSIVSGICEPSAGTAAAQLAGINIAFAVQAALCAVATVVTFVAVKEYKHLPDMVISEDRDLSSSLVLSSISSTAFVHEAVQALHSGSIDVIAVVDEDNVLQGVMTDGDVVRALVPETESYVDPAVLLSSMSAGDTTWQERIDSVMESHVSSIAPRKTFVAYQGDDMETVMRKMKEHKLRQIPMVDADEHFLGFVSRSDLTLHVMNEYIARKVAAAHKDE